MRLTICWLYPLRGEDKTPTPQNEASWYLSNVLHTREYGTCFLGSWTVAHTRQAVQKCLERRRHSTKMGPLRRQAINIAPLERVRAWGDGSLRLKERRSQLVWHECRLRRPRLTTTGTMTHPTWSAYQATRLVELCPSSVGHVVTLYRTCNEASWVWN